MGKKLYAGLSQELRDNPSGSRELKDSDIDAMSSDGFTELQTILNKVISENPDRVFEIKHDDRRKSTYFVWRKLEG
jgi:hypothetical protein